MEKYYDENFNDYLQKYRNIEHLEWITIYEYNAINGNRNHKNDIYSISVILDKNTCEVYLKELNFEYENDEFESENKSMKYLVTDILNIHPELLKYGHLKQKGNNYILPDTQEIIIKISDNNEKIVQIKSDYLKSFLFDFGYTCIIQFDNYRYYNKNIPIDFVIKKIDIPNSNIVFSIVEYNEIKGYNEQRRLHGKLAIEGK